MDKTIQISGKIVTIKPSVTLYLDHRGWIITPGKDEVEEPVTQYQPRIISTISGETRGNHYHQEETETIFFLSGLWDMFFSDNRGHFKQSTQLDCAIQPNKIVIPPMVGHAFTNRSQQTAYLYHYSDRPYKKDRSIQLLIT